MGVVERDPISQLRLPPGFRFYPTDEELLVQYLCQKIAGHDFPLRIIGEIDLYKFDPWFLPSKALFGEKEWYFFSPRDRKYPNGSRPNRVAVSGYWKATGSDRVITTKGRKIGIKKALVFYVGKAPKGTKTNWIMHEYRISEPPKNNGSSRLDDWVLCRIYKKHSSGEKSINGVPSEEHSHASSSSCSSQFDGMIESLPEIEHRFFSLPRVNSLKAVPQDDTKFNLQSLGSGGFDWATLDGLTSLPELVPGVQAQGSQQQGQANSNQNDIYVPYTSQFSNVNSRISNSVDEEVESGFRTHGIDNNSGFLHQQNLNQYGVAQSQTFTNSIDPFGNRVYSTQPGSFLFSQ